MIDFKAFQQFAELVHMKGRHRQKEQSAAFNHWRLNRHTCPRCQRLAEMTQGGMWHCPECRIAWKPE